MSKIFELKDMVANTTVVLVIAETAGQAVRDNCPIFWQQIPQGDLQITEVGEWDRNKSKGSFYKKPIVINWREEYKFPEVKAKNESRTVEEDIKKMQKVKEEIEENTTKEAIEARNTTNTQKF